MASPVAHRKALYLSFTFLKERVNLAEAAEVANEAILNKQMLVVVGSCSVDYHGRAGSRLETGERLVIAKGDGAFLIHQAHKMNPVNYQPPGCAISCSLDGGTFIIKSERTSPRESIVASFNRVDFAQSFDLKDASEIEIVGTERELHNLLLQDLGVIEAGLTPLKSESFTGRGAMDIVARDSGGKLVIIELKRRKADLDAVTQLRRYVEEARRKEKETRGILCAPSISDRALVFLQKEGFEFRKLDFAVKERAEIRGLESRQKRLDLF